MFSGRETIAEHRETAKGFRLGRLVLKNVPVLCELAVFETHDIGGDPCRGRRSLEESSGRLTENSLGTSRGSIPGPSSAMTQVPPSFVMLALAPMSRALSIASFSAKAA
jgi:hypothetical protein